jgi:mono/diheme cytochrome c family protein
MTPPLPEERSHAADAGRQSARWWLLATVSCLVAVFMAGCQQKMANQPCYRPLAPSAFFTDGMSARRPPDGAIAREWLRNDDPLMTGLTASARGSPAPAGEKATTPPKDAPSDPAKFVDAFPFELTRADLARGQERYTIFCAVCHDPLGAGNGKIPERGYIKPPNYHTDSSRGFALYRRTVPLRAVPVGYLFEVISRGYGAMPRYANQVPPKDRWRIAAYVRALQLSQHAELTTLPPTVRQAAMDALGGPP